MAPLRQKVDDVIQAIGKAPDLSSDLEKAISRLEPNSPLDPLRKRNWRELMTQIQNSSDNSNLINNLVLDLTRDLSGATISATRLNTYNNITSLRKKIPITGRAIRVWVDNILSPDDITKKSLQVTMETTGVNDSSYTGIENQYKEILKHLEIEDLADSIISDTLLLGDQFVEINSTQEYLDRVLEKNSIKLSEVQKELYKGKNISKKMLMKEEIDIEFLDTTKLSELSSSEVVSLQIREDDTSDKLNKLPDEDPDLNKDDAEDFEVGPAEDGDDPEDWDLDDGEDDEDEDADPNKPDEITLADLTITIHDPRNIIVLNKKKTILGYLYVDAAPSSTYAAASSTHSQGSYANKNAYGEEEEISNAVVTRLYKQVVDFLSKKSIKDVPSNMRDTLANILDIGCPVSKVSVRFIPFENMEHFKTGGNDCWPYGASIFADLEFVLKLYLARMVATTIYNISRTGKHLAIYVNLDGTRDARNRIETVKRAMRKKEVTASSLDSVDTIPSIVSTFEDFFIPVVDGKKMVEIEPLSVGDPSDRSSEDNSLLKAILTGIEIPPSLLGVEEFNNSKATLSQESVVFARSVVRQQKQFSKHFTNLARKVYKIIHPDSKDTKYLDMIITFLPPRGLMVDIFSNMYRQIKEIHNSLKDLGVPEKWIKERFLPEVDWEEVEVENLANSGKNKEGGAAGAAGDIFSNMGDLGAVPPSAQAGATPPPAAPAK